MEMMLWLALVLIVYGYVGYPLLLIIIGRLFPKPVHKSFQQPFVSIIVSVWNEERVIARKINNLLQQNYPPEKIEIIIGSDGSTDQTSHIVRSFQDPRVILKESLVRSGKAAIVNYIVPQVKGDVIVFNDARQDLEVNAVQELVNNFTDPQVGCVSGELVFRPKAGATAEGISLYWTYEKCMRDYEARLHSMLGATGAIYAIRRSLFMPIPQQVVLDDMYVPFKIIEQGYRAIYDASAKAFDEVADTPQEEYRRKARTLYGNYQIFSLFKHMFNPFKSKIAIQFFSHKFLRVIIPLLMIIAFGLNGLLLDKPFYVTLFQLQIIFYVMALIGAIVRERKTGVLALVSKFCFVPYVFCLLNFSALIGFYRYLFAKQETTWQKAKTS